MDQPDSHLPDTDNIGNLERCIRAVLGAIMIEAAPAAPDPIMGWLFIAALYPLFTAIIAWDPLYSLFRKTLNSPAVIDTDLAPYQNAGHQENIQEGKFDKAV